MASCRLHIKRPPLKRFVDSSVLLPQELILVLQSDRAIAVRPKSVERAAIGASSATHNDVRSRLLRKDDGKRLGRALLVALWLGTLY
jgi:hypothetical protein